MTGTQSNLENEAELLRDLLNEEQREREAISKHLHAKKSDVLAVKFMLHPLEKRIADGSFKKESLLEIRQTLDGLINELRSINATVFAAEVKLLGLVMALKQFVAHDLSDYEVRTDCSFLTETVPGISHLKETAIYKLCTGMILYVCLCHYKHLTILAGLKQDHFEFEITGSKPERRLLADQSPAKKLRLIRAGLIWQQATIWPETNWKDRFRVSFDL